MSVLLWSRDRADLHGSVGERACDSQRIVGARWQARAILAVTVNFIESADLC